MDKLRAAWPVAAMWTRNNFSTSWLASTPLKKPPGEGTGPTIHADFRGILVGRVPSRGERDVFERAANHSRLWFFQRTRGFIRFLLLRLGAKFDKFGGVSEP